MKKESPKWFTNRQKWFTDRIGKRVFRNKVGCKCPTCQNVNENGLIISDEMHATYLCDVECEFTAEGNDVRYFDTMKEVKEFEKN